MTRSERNAIVGWWWGRVFPPEIAHLANKRINDLEDHELERMDMYKEICQLNEEQGMECDYGFYTTIGDWYE